MLSRWTELIVNNRILVTHAGFNSPQTTHDNYNPNIFSATTTVLLLTFIKMVRAHSSTWKENFALVVSRTKPTNTLCFLLYTELWHIKCNNMCMSVRNKIPFVTKISKPIQIKSSPFHLSIAWLNKQNYFLAVLL